MSRAARFVALWNAGRCAESVANTGPDYTYQDAIMGGPHDREAHIALMESVLTQVPDRHITIERQWTVGDVEFVAYRWTGTPSGGGDDRIESEWLAIFEFDGEVLLSQRHYSGRCG